MATSSGAAGSLSIVVPAYNEAARIGDSLRAVCDYVTAAEVDAEVLVVDDGSTDDTAAVATRILQKRGIEHRILTGRPNRGKGYTVREGGQAARKEWTLMTDADLSTPIAEVDRLLAAAAEGGYSLVMGSRALPDSRIGVRQTWLRQNMGRTFNLMVRLLTGLEIRDTQCGFKLWRTRTVAPLLPDLRVDGFAWDVELLMVAKRAGLTMTEVPVEWNDAVGTKVGLLSDPLRMIRDILRIRLRR
jgi:dolichyl-phosphate beta-glucosyltransferase